MRRAAIAALNDIGSADAVSLLETLLNGRDAGTKEGAARALGSIGSAEAVEGLEECVERSER